MDVARALDAISAYGYPLLFVAAAAEHTFLVGLAVPGDVVVVVGGMLAARGLLGVPETFGCIMAGVAVGLVVSYVVGARGGIPLIARWGGKFGLTPVRIVAVEAYFRRHGAKTVFIAAFVAGIKNLVPAIAGASKMSFLRFFAYAMAGCAIRAAAEVAIGYAVGANLDRAMVLVRALNVWAVAIAVIIVLALLAVHRARRRPRDR